MTTIKCDIVSAEEEIFSGDISMLVAASHEGDVGIVHGHAAMLTSLKPGPIRLKQASGNEDVYYVSGGYLEVQPHTVTVLADTVLRGGDMDESAAEQAVKDAEKALSGKSGEVDYDLAATRLAEAAAQLRTLKAIRRKIK